MQFICLEQNQTFLEYIYFRLHFSRAALRQIKKVLYYN